MRYTSKFLQGKTVLITREKSQAAELSEEIIEYGGVPIEVPLLSFQEPKAQLKQTTLEKISQLSKFDWLVFTSKNGVEFFTQYLKELGIKQFPDVKIAAIGKKTLEAIERSGWKTDFTPPIYVAEVFLSSFLEILNMDERVLICKGNLARDYIATGLESQGILVEEAIVYENVVPEGTEETLLNAFSKQKIDVVLFTSPSAINNLMDIVQKNQLFESVQDSIIVSIGPVTTKRINEHGLSVSVTPRQFTVEHMLEELKAFLIKEGDEPDGI